MAPNITYKNECEINIGPKPPSWFALTHEMQCHIVRVRFDIVLSTKTHRLHQRRTIFTTNCSTPWRINYLETFMNKSNYDALLECIVNCTEQRRWYQRKFSKQFGFRRWRCYGGASRGAAKLARNQTLACQPRRMAAVGFTEGLAEGWFLHDWGN